MNTVYENIRKRREHLGMSQEQLAKLAHYTSRSSIAKIESGAVDISLPKLEAIAKALDTDCATLLGWDVPKETITELHSSIDYLVDELSVIDQLKVVLSHDDRIGDYEFNDDQLMEILDFARFKAGR